MIKKEDLAGLGIESEEVQSKLLGLVDSKLGEISKKHQDEINNAVNKAYGNVESVLSEVTGVPKPDGTKTSDYAKTAIQTLKEQSNAKLKELESKIKSGTISEEVLKENETLKSQVSTFSETIKNKENEWKEQLTTKEKEFLSYKLNISFKESLPKFSEEANPFEVKHHVDTVINQLQKEYELNWDDEGNFVATKNFVTKPVKDIIAENENIKKLIDVPRSQTGTGANRNQEPNPNQKLDLAGLDDASKIIAIRKHITEVLKIDNLSPQYAETFAKLMKG